MEQIVNKNIKDFPFEILYEDENVIVVNKPAGLTVHPSAHETAGTLTDYLLEKYPEIKGVGEDCMSEADKNPVLEDRSERSERRKKPEGVLSGGRGFCVRPGLVHRLDKDTSGVLIVARNQKAFEFLKNQFQTRQVAKQYIALVAGSVAKKEGIIDFPIARYRKMPTRQVAVQSPKQARGKIREAVTKYKVLRHLVIEGKPFTLIAAFPETGRLHQIRAHFAAIGHPLAGDIKYGNKNKVLISGLGRHFLHAILLTVNMFPDGKEQKTFIAPLPPELSTVIGGLQWQADTVKFNKLII